MPAVGTCWKREGTQAFFYSRKGAWPHPREIKGIDPVGVMPGYKYEIDFDSGQISNRGQNSYFEKDLQEHGLPDLRGNAAQGVSQPAGAANAPNPSTTAGMESPRLDGLLASATGVAKSCLESGKCNPYEALRWGAHWASLWGPVPTGVFELLNTPKLSTPERAKAEIEAMKASLASDTPDPDDGIPF